MGRDWLIFNNREQKRRDTIALSETHGRTFQMYLNESQQKESVYKQLERARLK